MKQKQEKSSSLATSKHTYETKTGEVKFISNQ